MSVELWLGFVAASAILLIFPGPTILTVISHSVARGRRATVPLVTAALQFRGRVAAERGRPVGAARAPGRMSFPSGEATL